jgi:hypothetical protein
MEDIKNGLNKTEEKILKAVGLIGEGEVDTRGLAALSGLREERVERATADLEDREVIGSRLLQGMRFFSVRAQGRLLLAAYESGPIGVVGGRQAEEVLYR